MSMKDNIVWYSYLIKKKIGWYRFKTWWICSNLSYKIKSTIRALVNGIITINKELLRLFIAFVQCIITILKLLGVSILWLVNKLIPICFIGSIIILFIYQNNEQVDAIVIPILVISGIWWRILVKAEQKRNNIQAHLDFENTLKYLQNNNGVKNLYFNRQTCKITWNDTYGEHHTYQPYIGYNSK